VADALFSIQTCAIGPLSFRRKKEDISKLRTAFALCYSIIRYSAAGVRAPDLTL
jgi:hypothetical protein